MQYSEYTAVGNGNCNGIHLYWMIYLRQLMIDYFLDPANFDIWVWIKNGYRYVRFLWNMIFDLSHLDGDDWKIMALF